MTVEAAEEPPVEDLHAKDRGSKPMEVPVRALRPYDSRDFGQTSSARFENLMMRQEPLHPRNSH